MIMSKIVVAKSQQDCSMKVWMALNKALVCPAAEVLKDPLAGDACVQWSAVLTSGGIIPLLDGGITTLRSGLRPPIPMFPPGGGGDLVGMTLPRPLPLGELWMPGEPLEFTKPFPAEVHSNRNTSSNYRL